MELIHNNTTKVATVNLSVFEGVWVECTEVIYIHPTDGKYSMVIKNVKDGSTVLSYTNNKLMTIRSDNTFDRPKWGIYRSLDHPTDLRDEAIRFAGFEIQEGVTGIEKVETEIPKSFSIEQNYPNPFNPTTSISFFIPRSEYVSLKVYDSTGKEVANLVDGFKSAGNYKIKYDASQLSSGIYLYRIRSANFIQVKKMILTK
jgi:hypothetical protein